MMAIEEDRPWTVRTQAPVRPEATSPASIMPMMKPPKTVPTMVARPPKIEVPPISTGGDGGQQVALALVAEIVLVLERQHDRGDGREPAHQREQLDLLALDVDADDARDGVRIAHEQHVLAEAVAVEDEPEDDDDQRRPQGLDRQLRPPGVIGPAERPPDDADATRASSTPRSA